MAQNHVIDPTYFYDAIEEFAFDYTLYAKQVDDEELTDDGYSKVTYLTEVVRGSLQSGGATIVRSKTGNMTERYYDFYCKSLYRVHIDDIITYKDNYFICTDVNDYDEWGVRHAKFKMITLTQYRDFAEFIKYKQGQILI